MATPGNPAEDDLLDDVAEETEGQVEETEVEEEEAEGEGEQPKHAAAVLPSQKKGGKEPVAPVVPKEPTTKTVPLATFLQEKSKFTEALDNERNARIKLEKEIEALKNPPKAPPKHADDPEGFIAHATRESAKSILYKLEEHGKALQEVTNATTTKNAADAEKAFMDELDRGGREFATTAPDYGDALHHVRRIAFQQLKLWHPDASDAQIIDAIGKQEIAMAKTAIQQGRNPHEMAYHLALANGYKKADPLPGNKKNGKASKKAAAPVEVEEEEEEVLDPSQTLGRSNGEATEDDDDDDVPDPDTVDSFDDAFREVFKPKQRRRAF
jgi:hypothetical protein